MTALPPFEDHDAPLYDTGQVARMLDVQPAFLRRLDQEQVVQPARSDGGQRRYSMTEVLQLRRVTEMADSGITLVGIRRILELEAELAELRRQIEESGQSTRDQQASSTAPTGRR